MRLRSRARAFSQSPDTHANVTVYRTKSGLGTALRAKRIAALRAGLDAGNMLFNLRGHKLLLQTCKQCFALSYRQSRGSRRDFLRPLDHPHVVFDGAAWGRLKYQLDYPFHPQRLTQPTTLHTLAFQMLGRKPCFPAPTACYSWDWIFPSLQKRYAQDLLRRVANWPLTVRLPVSIAAGTAKCGGYIVP